MGKKAKVVVGTIIKETAYALDMFRLPKLQKQHQKTIKRMLKMAGGLTEKKKYRVIFERRVVEEV